MQSGGAGQRTLCSLAQWARKAPAKFHWKAVAETGGDVGTGLAQTPGRAARRVTTRCGAWPCLLAVGDGILPREPVLWQGGGSDGPVSETHHSPRLERGQV